MAQTSGCRQNFHEDCEANINKQINMELYASYVYMSMVSVMFYISLVFTLVQLSLNKN